MPSFIQGIDPKVDSIPGVRHFIQQALDNLAQAHDAIIESRVNQAHYTNCGHRNETPFEQGDLIYLSTKNLSFPKG
ncbi:hypothetical protein HYDPIDRAFT_101611 [Hydnomerulius pinastri MD-312]|uniref:Uncharacterized protein n=1 Tax=Hydnomerulius pinastri MD-312 TaxID=994086 RepID=A0A0C9V155_9AGAM|nr:hypothetical protein HYDPIDRAFT_101611 [Hydnomerulius pinastri MD-312]